MRQCDAHRTIPVRESRSGSSPMMNKDAANLLDAFADILEIKGANQFRVRAFRNASRRIDGLAIDLSELVETNSLEQVQGIGKSIAGFLSELVTTGRVSEYEEMRAEVPPGVFDLLRVPGLGPKTTATLYNELNITSVDELEAAARDDQLATVKNIGPKRQERLLRELKRFHERRTRHLLGDALPIAERLIAHVRNAPGVSDASFAGSLRRMRDTIGDLDILAASDDPDAVMEHFIKHEEVEEVLASGPTKTRVLVAKVMQVDLLVVSSASFGAALVYFTGSQDHNIELRQQALKIGLSLNEWGFDNVDTKERRPAPTEDCVYSALGLTVIPPELREGRGEIAAAKDGCLPELIELSDIRGEFHGHSLWSDGAASIDGMVESALALGYGFIAVTDHSGGLKVANGLTPERLQEQGEEIAVARNTFTDIHVLRGSEVEIHADGTLDYDDEVLAELDVVVASIHSHFNQPRNTMTERIVSAIWSPHVDVIGHPTGRILGYRDGYEFDVEAVLAAAAETGTAMEINASPERLDLDDVMARRAKDLGVPLAINSDAHRPESYGYMRYGIATARRAWVTPGDVLNAMEPDALKEWFQQPKPRQWIPHR